MHLLCLILRLHVQGGSARLSPAPCPQAHGALATPVCQEPEGQFSGPKTMVSHCSVTSRVKHLLPCPSPVPVPLPLCYLEAFITNNLLAAHTFELFHFVLNSNSDPPHTHASCSPTSLLLVFPNIIRVSMSPIGCPVPSQLRATLCILSSAHLQLAVVVVWDDPYPPP